MNKFIFPALLFLCLTACQNSEGGGEGSAVPPSTRNDAAAPAPTQPRAATSSSADGVALNPPHGEPGHVCEIPVGEPLDGSGSGGDAGGAPNDIVIDPGTAGGTSTIISPSMSPGASSSTTAPGTNPPHGQPGHVCEIPVGDPLP